MPAKRRAEVAVWWQCVSNIGYKPEQCVEIATNLGITDNQSGTWINISTISVAEKNQSKA
jgi:hypothetical protein